MADTNTNFNSTVRESGREISSLANDAADMASDAADRVSNAASRAQKQVTDYVSSHNASDMLKDLNSYVKKYPTQAIVAAAAVGFIAAALLRRR